VRDPPALGGEVLAEVLKPLFSSPSRSSTGTSTSSKESSAVSEARRPSLSSLRPTEYPGDCASTANKEMPKRRSSSFAGLVRAATIIRSACTPPVMKVFAPLST